MFPFALDALAEPIDAALPARVLVVESHVAVRMAVLRVLDNEAGLESVAVGTREGALEAATNEHFDLAVVGYEAADGDGLTLTRDLRCLPQAPRVLIHSESVDTGVAALATVAGADAVLDTARLGVELGQAVRDSLHGRARSTAPPMPVIARLGLALPMEERRLFRMWASGADEADVAKASGLPTIELERRRRRILTSVGRSPGRPRLSRS